jgi:S1-C subfamily serine protease
VEYVAPLPRAVQEVLPGSELVGVLENAPDASYHGSPFVSGDGRLLGLVNVSREGWYVLPASDVSILLEDVLRHPTGGAVSVLGGIRGVWVSGAEVPRAAPSSSLAFVVENVAARSPAAYAGLKTQDVIVGADDKMFPGAGSLWVILLEGTRAQKPVTLNVRRKDETFSVVFTPRPENP